MTRTANGILGAGMGLLWRRRADGDVGAATLERRAVGRLYQLDVLRGVAILLVFGFHLYGFVFRNSFEQATGAFFAVKGPDNLAFWAFHLFRYGGAGVPLFFILSGFCIHAAYLSAAERSGGRFEFRRFLARRAWRIYPAYFLALAVFGGIAWAKLRHGAARGDEAAVAAVGGFWLNVTTHLLNVHNLVGEHCFAFNPAFWSLAVEWQFYLAFPLLLWMRSRWGIAGAVGIAAALSVASRAALIAGGAEWRSYLWYLPTVSWFEWCLGAWVAERYVAGRSSLTGRSWAIPAVLLVLALGSGTLVASSAWLRTLWAVFFAAVLERYLRSAHAAGAARAGENAQPSWLERLLVPVGLCSYSLYLLHMPLLNFLLQQWRRRFGPHEMVELLVGFGLFLPVVAAVSWASYLYVEQWSMRMARGHRRDSTRPAETSQARHPILRAA